MLYCQGEVSKFNIKAGKVCNVVLDDGNAIEADIFVVAAGISI